MRLGNTTFNTSAIKKMSFKKFETLYKDLNLGCSLEDAFRKLGGKNGETKKSIKKHKEDKDK